MTVYARSDVMHVALSSEHGGCGAGHSRPVTHGAPAKLWALDCPRCENHLRSDPLWATMPADVPETPDEVKVREDAEKRGTRDRESQLVDAILAIANSQTSLPEQLAQALATIRDRQDAPVGDPVTKSCVRGHAVSLDSRFCPECGVAMAAHPEVRDVEPVPDEADLTRLTVVQLRDLATQRDLPATGNKADLITRLTARE